MYVCTVLIRVWDTLRLQVDQISAIKRLLIDAIQL